MCYPKGMDRSLLKRDRYISLDGIWKLDGKDIIVPYAPQAKRSMYNGTIKEEMTYTKTFRKPDIKDGERIILHFGAIDQIADVYINDVFMIHHEDGYLPFSIDITDVLDDDNVLKVRCIDHLDKDYPYGKQTKDPKGMWYTPISFIWQSVYLEVVPNDYIKDIKIKTTMDRVSIKLDKPRTYELIIDQDDIHYHKAFEGDEIMIDLKKEGLDIHLWDIDDPYLYHFSLKTDQDMIKSYFALREFKIKDIKGHKRFTLNDKPIFLCGLLDQGYYGDSLYTAFKDDYRQDILNAKRLGFNCLRKHIKVESDVFYEACDELGILVIQDFVNSGDYNFIKDTALPNIGFKRKSDHKPHTKRHDIFIDHAKKVKEILDSHPCIIAYTIFNEGWGQFDADHVYELLKKDDEDHILDATSGWFIRSKSDLDSEHIYFRNKVLKAKDRALLLSECGGYVYSDEKDSYGYGSSKDLLAHMQKIEKLYERMIYPSIKYGLDGFIYTQIYDVETERNGLYKEDHKTLKVDGAKLKALNERCHKLLEETI